MTRLRNLYGIVCKYNIAKDHFQNALAAVKKLKSEDLQHQHMGFIYIDMGWMYLNQGACYEQNALEVFGMGLFNACPDRLVDAFRGMGLAYYGLEEWDHAIEAFQKSIARSTDLTQNKRESELHVGQVYVASTYIEKCRALPLHVGPEKRTEF